MTTPFKRLVLAGGVVLVVLLAALLFVLKHDRQVVFQDQDGTTIILDEINSGFTSASGDFTTTIAVNYPDGTPASGQRYRLQFPVSSSNIVVSTGVLSTNGEAVISGLAGGNPPAIYYLYVEDQSLGVVAVNANRETNRFEGLLPAKAGMQAPDLALMDLKLRESFHLSDLRGRIVFLEFYTTDCAPCQPVLASLNALVEDRAADWNGKVAILAVGLDAVWQPDRRAESVAQHLRRKGWKSLNPVVPDQAFSREPAKRFPFGVNAVPYSFVIGGEGTILWSGIPSAHEIERKIEEFLQKGSEGNGENGG